MAMSTTKRRLPPPNWLRSFEAAARHLSFTVAAHELHITQAAVSQHIRLLEHFLQQRLFDRQPRKITLTQAGEAYLPAVKEAFEKLAASTEQLFGNDKSKQLTIKCDVSFASLWLSQRLPSFQQAFPQYEIRIANEIWIADIGWDNVDLSIRYGTGDWSGMTAWRLTRERIIPACSPAFLEQITLDNPMDITRHPLIRLVGADDYWPQWLEHSSGETLNTTLPQNVQVDSSQLGFEYAANGYGFVMAKYSLLAPYLQRGLLITPFKTYLEIDAGYFYVCPANRTESPAALAFRDWLFDQVIPLSDSVA